MMSKCKCCCRRRLFVNCFALMKRMFGMEVEKKSGIVQGTGKK